MATMILSAGGSFATSLVTFGKAFFWPRGTTDPLLGRFIGRSAIREP